LLISILFSGLILCIIEIVKIVTNDGELSMMWIYGLVMVAGRIMMTLPTTEQNGEMKIDLTKGRKQISHTILPDGTKTEYVPYDNGFMRELERISEKIGKHQENITNQNT
jgi:CRISPR/Cas system-associated protein Cas7 (RAMP superfamily)